jgi:hypothetical protein
MVCIVIKLNDGVIFASSAERKFKLIATACTIPIMLISASPLN